MTENEKTNSEKKGFVDGLKTEFREIVWPTQEVPAKQTATVVAVSLVLDTTIAVLDWAFRLELTRVFQWGMGERMAETSWYVVHIYSGYENKVKVDIEKSVENRRLQDQILEVSVPIQPAAELRNNVEKTVERKMFPDYMLIRMIMNDETWYVVRNTRGVTGFVGPGSEPMPLSEEEIQKLGFGGGEQMAVRKIVLEFAPGNTVTVVSGPWKDAVGKVAAINKEKRTVTLPIDMFSRETLVEFKFTQVKKL